MHKITLPKVGNSFALFLIALFVSFSALGQRSYDSSNSGRSSINATGFNNVNSSTLTDFAAGAAVIDMGIVPQTANNALKPYGLVYELVTNYDVPVYWLIKDGKSFQNPNNKVDETDITVQGTTTRLGNVSTGSKQLKSGPFLIPAEFIDDAYQIMEQWVADNNGLTIYWNLQAITDAPVRGVITTFPNAVIYPKDGNLNSNNDTDIETGFYNRAGIDATSGKFRKGLPTDITSCDQFYVLSHHTDPNEEWSQADVNTLYDFVLDGGNVWMGCHDVSINESLTTSGGRQDPYLNFLSTNRLMPYKDLNSTAVYDPPALPKHDNNFDNDDVDYDITTASDPIMQFMGEAHPAFNGNSEKIYLPLSNSQWRPETSIGFFDPTHPDIPGNSPGRAGILVYGPAYGNSDYGSIVYSGSHISNKNSGNNAQWVGEARTFGNFLLQSALETAPQIAVASLPNGLAVCSGGTLGVTASLSDVPAGTQSYLWESEVISGPGGPLSFTPNNGLSTTIGFPNVSALTTYKITFTLTIDPGNCGNPIVAKYITSVSVNRCNITLTKSAEADPDNCNPFAVGDPVTYNFQVSNTGSAPITNVQLSDPLLGGIIPGPSGGDNGNGVLDSGETWTYTAVYNVTQADIDAGQIENQASVAGLADGFPVSDLSDDATGLPVPFTGQNNSRMAVYTTAQPGNWNNGSTWVGGVPPLTLTNGDVVNINHRVVSDETHKLQGNSVFNVNSIFKMTNGNIEIESSSAVVNINNGIFIITNGSFLNKQGTVNMTNGAVQLCNDNYSCEASAPNGTFGTGYIFTENGNVENIGNGTFSTDISWCADDGDGVNMPTTENCMLIDPNGCEDENFFMTFLENENDPTIIEICQDAAIAVVKTADVTVDPNDNCVFVNASETITYQFAVSNQGNVSLDNVVLDDPLLGGPVAGPASGDDGDNILEPGETWIYEADYTVLQSDIDNGSITNQATVTADDPNDDQVSDMSHPSDIALDDDTVTVLCQTPEIALVKVANVALDPADNCYDVVLGGTIDYTLTVSNEGGVSLDNVVVNDPLLGGDLAGPVSGDTGNDGILGLNEEWVYNASYTITQADLDAGMVTNTATVTANDPNDDPVTDQSGATVNDDDDTETPVCQSPGIAIVKDATYDDGGDCSDVGETIDYTFTVTNTGNVALSNISVTDPLVGLSPISFDGGDTDNDTELDLGETWTYSASYVLTQADIDFGSVTNQATATGTPPSGPDVSDLSGATVNEDSGTVVTLCNNADIALIKVGTYDGFDQAGNCVATAGDQITYAFTVTNTGNVTLTNVTVTDLGVVMSGGPIASLAPGASDSTTFTASYTITQADIDAGEFSNQATAEGTTPSGGTVDDLSDDNSNTEDDPTVTSICNSASIALIKVGTYDGFDQAGNCVATAGDQITYAFTVTNTGNVTLTNVTVTDLGVVMSGGPIASLAPGASDSTTFTASYTITQADIDAGEFSNQATAEGTTPSGGTVDDLSDDNSNTEDDPTVTSICSSASIALIKVGTYDGFDQAGNCVATAGDQITYAFTVTNTGNVTLTNVTVTDLGVVMSGGPIASLAPGASDSTTFTASYTITQADIDAGEFSNQATAEGTTPSGGTVDDLSDDNSNTEDDPTVTSICNSASIALIKVGTYDGFDQAGNCVATAGDQITYAFTVTNTGNVTLTNVTVTDLGVVMSGGPIASLAPGASDSTTFTASYTITQADIDAGEFSNQATAEGTTPSGGTVDDLSDDNSNTEDDPTVTSICSNASIAIVKTASYDDGGDCSDVGERIDYTFTVTNTGNVALSNISVTDPLVGLSPISFDGGDTDNDTELDLGETWTYSASYVLTQADIDFGSVTNQATATGTPPSGPDVSDLSGATVNEDSGTVVTLCNNADIALIKVGTYDGFDQAGNCVATAGDQITYAFTVTNTGNVTLTNVTVTDLGVVMSGGPIASLAPGASDSTTFTASYTITQADIDAGEFSNQATAEGTTPSGGTVDDLSDDNSNTEDDPTVTSICNSASIALIKVGTYDGFDQAGNCVATAGDQITYAFTVTNTGNVTLTNVTVTDLGVVMSGGPIASLAPGASDSTTFTASYTITQADIDAGEFSNQATAEGTTPSGGTVDDLSDDNSNTEDDPTVTSICSNASIAIVKTASYDDGGDCSDVGERIDYTFTVTNTGNVALSNISVTDPLVGLSPISFDGGDTDNDTELDLGETWTYSASYVLTQADIDFGSVTNQATATGTPPSGPDVSDLSGATVNEDSGTVVTLCNNADIALIKVGTYDGFDQAGNCVATAGDQITYAFTVTNTGNVTLTNVTVTDLGVVMSGGPIASLAPGASDSTTFTATYTITQADIDAGEFSNQATAEGTTPSGGTVDDLSDDNSNTEDDPTVTSICNSASIALIKVGTYDGFDQAGNCVATAGDQITYAFTVTNTGNVTLTNVTVTDLGVVMSGGPIASLAPGASDSTTFTASYTITQADIDAGEFSNQATAEGTTPSGGTVDDLSDDNSNTEDDPTVTSICNSASIALIKVGTYDGFDQAGNCVATAGDQITYAFTVTNTGNVTLTNVTVTDLGVVMSGGPIASLAPGASDSTTFTASYTITQADIDAGEFSNQATAEGTTPSGGTVDDLSDDNSNTEDDPTVTSICSSASIALIKVGTYDGFDQAGNCVATAGDQITYAFTVTNTGNVTLTNVTVTDLGVVMSGGPIASLAPGASDSTTFTASYTITQADIDAGEFSNQATAEGTTPSGGTVDDLSDDNSNTEDDPTVTSICSNASIAIVKTASYDDGGDCSDVGERIDYTFTVTNTGNVALSNISVTDPLVGLSPISFDGGDTDNDTELDLGETWTYSASYVLTQADIDFGSVTNQATATGTPPSGPDVSDLSGATVNEDSGTVVTLCNNADIALIKVGTYDGFDQAGNCVATAGDQITYAFTVTNTGNVTLTNVTVTDLGVVMSGGPIASLAPGASDSTTFTASYTITQADIDAGEFSNQATAEGTTPSGGTVDDLSDDNSNTEDDPTVTSICNSASIALIKVGTYDGFDQAGNCVATAGDQITYAFTVTNTGNVTLTNVTVTDLGVVMSGGPIASLAPGASDSTTFTASYTITQADIDAGEFSNQATAEGTTPSGGTVDDLSDDNSNTEDDPTVTSICQNPAIAIVKTGIFNDENGDQCTDPNETITYTFVVTNEGNVSLSSISVTDPLVASITFVSGDTDNDGELDVDETWTYTGDYSITQADIDNGSVENQATAEGTAPDQTVVDDLSDESSVLEDDPTITNLCQQPAIAIVKTGVFNDENGDQCTDPNETITYTFVVTNEGNVSLSSISVTDPLVTPITFVSGDTDNDGELDVDETWTYTGDYSITQADIDTGSVENQATAEGTAPDQTVVDDLSDESSVLEDDPTITNLCQQPAIAIVKTGVFNDENGDQCTDPNETITYTFVVTNEGNVSLSSISVTDPLIAPITFVSGDTDNDGELDVDETWTYTGDYSITQADIDTGSVENQATAEGTAPDQTVVDDLSDESSVLEDDPTITNLCQQPAIAIVKTGVFNDENGDQCTDPNETITYTFVVTNEGNVSLSSISVTDPLVTPITFVSGDTDNDGELDVDETWTYTGDYSITQADIDAGMVENQATAEGTAPDQTVVDDLSDESSVLEDDPTITNLCQQPAIAIVKTGIFNDENGDQCTDPNETITYTFVVTNQGNVSLSNITLTDPLIAPITFVSGDTDNDGELDVDETWTYTGDYSITQADIDAGMVENQATAEGTAPDQTVVDDLSDESSVLEDDPTITNLCQQPAIAIVKTGVFNDENGDQCTDPNETITYTFVVTNEGNVSLSSISVTDPLVAPITFVSGDTDNDGELDVDETWTYTGDYSITQADIDTGSVENQATAEGTAPDQTVVDDLSDESSVLEDDPTITNLCQQPAIAIVKTGVFNDENGDQCTDPNETITYTFVVTNEGNVSLSSISVTDPLVTPITFVSGDTDNDGELDVDETWTYTGDYSITQADIDTGSVENQATAEGTAPDQTVVDDLSDESSVLEDDPTITNLCQQPAIAIVKTGVFNDENGDQCTDPNETITYTFVVTNEGNVSLSSISVTDPLIAPITFVSGDTDNDGELDVDETWTYTGDYSITQADIDNGSVENQATAEGTAPDQTVVDDLSDESSVLEDDPTITNLCQQPAIAIVKTGVFNDENGDQCTDPNETITYTFVVTNEGNVSLSSISVTDPLVTPITFVSGDTDNDGELDVDETWTYTGDYSITQADIDTGSVENQATAEGTAPDQTVVDDLSDESSVLEDDPTITNLCQQPAIAIVKTGVFNDENGDQCTDPNETITYTFVVTNEGNVSLSSISVTDPLIAPITFVSGDTDNDGELDVDETWTYTGDYSITQADIDTGSVENQATAEGTAPDQTVVDDLSDESSVLEDDPTITNLCQQPAIAIVKTGVFNDENGDQCTDPNETITYTFVVTNEGNVSLSSISVTDPLVTPITFVSGDTDNDGELDVDETWTYTGDYSITQADIDAGMVENQATAEGTAPDQTVVDDLSDESSVLEDDPTITNLCQQPAIAIVKTGVFNDENGDQCTDPNETITYTFVVTNQGNVSLSNITVTDPLIAPITFVSGDTDNDGELDVDETWTYTGDYSITQADIDTGSVENQATAEGTAPDQTVVDDLSDESSVLEDDPTITTLCQDPAIAIVKESSYDDGGDCSQPGEEIFYTFTVTNEGNVTLSNIVVTDPLLGGVVAGPDSGDDGDGLLQVNEVWVYTGSYVITQDDIDAGEVFNQATAEGTAPDQSIVEDLSGSTTSTDDGTITTLCQDPAIAIVKEAEYDDGGDCSQPGEEIFYTFTVTNEGNVTLSNIVVTDPLLGGVVAGPDSGDDNPADGQLQVDEVWVYTGSYVITQDDIDAGEVFNQATAEGTAPDQSIVEDLSGSTTSTDDGTITTLCQDPAIAIVKEAEYDDGGDCSQPGEEIFYTFTVTNEGNVTLSNIVVTDPLLGGVVAGPVSGDDNPADGQLQVDEVWVYTGSYVITQDDIDAGEVFNQATAEGTAPDQSIVEDLSGSTTSTDDGTITTLCQDPAIAIVKEAEYDDGGDCSQPGEEIFYTFTVTNEGNVTLSNIVVTDPLLGGVVAGPVSGDDNPADGQLQVDEVWVYTGSYVITQDDIDAGEVFNQATAEGTAPDQSIVEDLSGSTTTTDDGTITTLCQDPAIAIVKEAEYDDGGDCSQPGEEIFYTFTVTNEGNVTLFDIDVDDPLLGGNVPGPDSGDTNGDGALQIDETWIYTGSYVITQDDIDAGEVFNQATAKGTAPDQSIVEDLSGSTTTTDDGTITVLCIEPSIAMIKTVELIDDDGDGCADVGESLLYTFSVLNTGNVPLTDVIVTDPLITVSGGPINLEPGEEDNTTFSGTYIVTEDDVLNVGEVVNQALVEGLDPEGNVVSDLSDDNSYEEDDPTIFTNFCVIVTSTYGVVAESVCINDVPYLSYEVTLPTSTTPGVVENVTIDWFDLDDNLVFTHTDLPLEGQVLWPGAEVDEDGNATDWPGWILVDGVWVEGDDGFQNLRPQAKITVSVEDDSDTLIVDYPPADPVCYSGPRMGAQFVKTDFNCEEPITPGSIDITISGGKGPFTFEWSTEDGEGLVPGAEDQTNLSAGTYTVLITDTVLQETVSFTIVIEQIGDCVLDAGFDIWNGVTPNGDGLNDFFWIEGIVNYPDNNLKVFNRWGVLVYEQDGYNESDRVFRGISEGRTTVRQGDELPTGTYYYVLEIYGDENPGQSSYAGYLYLNR